MKIYRFAIVTLLMICFFNEQTFATDRYMATTGVDVGDCSDPANPCSTLQYAMSQMNGGDTLYIDDGEYTSSSNKIWQFNFPPSGTNNSPTIIRAKNIPGLNGIPINQPLKVRFTGGASFTNSNYPNNDSNKKVEYIKFWGIRWDGIGTYTNWDHIYFKQVASQGVTDGNSAAITIGGKNNLLEDVVAFGKGRYKILFYDYTLTAMGNGNNLCRRCVIRHDSAMKNDTSPFPIAGITSYYNRGTACLNSIVIDSDTPSEWMDSPTELAGAFYQPNDTGPHAFIVNGCMVINTAMALITNRSGSSGHIVKDCVAVKVAGGLGLHGDTDVDRVTLIDVGMDNFIYRSTTQAGKVQAKNDGVFTWAGTKTIYDSIFADILDDGMDGGGISNNNINMYQLGDANYVGTAQAANFITTNPFLNGLKYPVRIETGLPLANQGSGGGQIGARIINKLGVDGTFKGDPGWDTEQINDPLWPWPLEGWVQAEMRTSQYTTNAYRGFCALGSDQFGKPMTLTRYIWQYLGNEIPATIYGAVDSTPPLAPTGLTIQ